LLSAGLPSILEGSAQWRDRGNITALARPPRRAGFLTFSVFDFINATDGSKFTPLMDELNARETELLEVMKAELKI
jgi:hypothetical protein